MGWSEKTNIQADKIYIIGYSFPATDVRSDTLFKSAFYKRKNYPEIIIVNPNPEKIAERFEKEFSIPRNRITVHKKYFTKDFNLNASA